MISLFPPFLRNNTNGMPIGDLVRIFTIELNKI